MPIPIRAGAAHVLPHLPPSHIEIGGEQFRYRASDLERAVSRFGANAVHRAIEAQEFVAIEARIGSAVAEYVETVLGLLDAAELRVVGTHGPRVLWEVAGPRTSLRFHTDIAGGDARKGSPGAISADPRQIALFGANGVGCACREIV
jgi:hypothetical protein